MKIYLVGGAVRDKILGLEVTERDWVVVGATPEQLVRLGFTQVGRDFPVFLHPETKEEYALARKERKIGPGYLGFECNTSSDVTLEEDLARRDLTLNAIAMDENGTYIDPYGGLRDIECRLLRHVSPAFVEDPVRVLRLARFAARFRVLGFDVAPETRALVYAMSRRGELNTLVPERVWAEWEKALLTDNPAIFIRVLRETGALFAILPEIAEIFGVPQIKTKPSCMVDVGERAMMRLEQFSATCRDPVLRFAVFCLELGKGKTPCQYWPFHPDEISNGVKALSDLSLRLKLPRVYHDLAELSLKWHLEIGRLSNLTPNEILVVLNQTDAWRRQARFESLLRVAETVHANPQLTRDWNNLRACAFEIPQKLIEKYQGISLKEAIMAYRLEQIKAHLMP